ncbi:lanthionine synthetase LanC family protein [Flavobacterium sp. ZS1P70]|uniref:Lanthionine synthetase LanC family protein n=1 Tax=Flavobacterium zhoui TaxID=3230414 RepID=A0ABW6I7B2_9FLAO
MNKTKKLITQINSYNSELFNCEGLLNGRAGLVYYYYCLYKHYGTVDYLDKIAINLELIFKNIENQNSSLLLNSTLESGLSGLGYILYLLMKENILDIDYDEQIKDINDLVYEDALKFIENKNYDFVRGPFGILYYLNFVGCENHVDDLVGKFYEEFLNNTEFMFYNNTTYLEGIHIGYAHGLCAIVKVFNEIDDPRCDFMVTNLLDKIVEIVNDNDVIIEGQNYYLPRSIHKDESQKRELNYRAVLAWSNSDVNFSTLIYSLKKKYITNELLELADKIALGSIGKIKEEHTRVWDHRFYFGSSGVLQMYNYMYQKTNNKKFHEASTYWYNKTLAFLNENTIKEHPLDFVNNLPATSLALLEFEESKSIGWSKLLLL